MLCAHRGDAPCRIFRLQARCIGCSTSTILIDCYSPVFCCTAVTSTHRPILRRCTDMEQYTGPYTAPLALIMGQRVSRSVNRILRLLWWLLDSSRLILYAMRCVWHFGLVHPFEPVGFATCSRHGIKQLKRGVAVGQC